MRGGKHGPGSVEKLTCSSTASTSCSPPAPLVDTLSLPKERRKMKLAVRIEIPLRQRASHHLGSDAPHFFGATSGSSFFPVPSPM